MNANNTVEDTERGRQAIAAKTISRQKSELHCRLISKKGRSAPAKNTKKLKESIEKRVKASGKDEKNATKTHRKLLSQSALRASACPWYDVTTKKPVV